MAKIHVRGGSPLRLRFEDDRGDALAVRLDPKGSTGEYWVITNGKRLEAFGEPPAKPDKDVFTPDCPDHQSCVITYLSKVPAGVP